MVASGRPHVARPASDDGGEIWITESIHKAALVADHRGAVALGSLGAGLMSTTVSAALAIDPERRRLAVVAADVDQRDKPNERNTARRYHDGGWRVALARWDAAAGSGPDDAIANHATITLIPWEPAPSPRGSVDRRIEHVYPWMHGAFDAEAHADALRADAERLADEVREHIAADNRDEVALIIGPAGLGKSRVISAVGQPDTAGMNPSIAWIATRHDLITDAMAVRGHPLTGYRHIRTANVRTCPEGHEAHAHLAAMGWNTAPIHRAHAGDCDYELQFRMHGSAVYQLAHVATSHITAHRAVGVDELDLSAWLPEHTVSITDLQIAARTWAVGSDVDIFIRAAQAVVTDADQTGEATAWHGRRIFDALDIHLAPHGGLVNVLGRVIRDPRTTDTRPWADVGDDLDAALALPKIALPWLVTALVNELPRWQRGGEWNSLIRIGPGAGSGAWALHVTTPRAFHGGIGPLFVMDATADPDLVGRLLGRPVVTHRATITPPPGMRHIAVRTGVRYGKRALTASHGRDRNRAIAQALYLLTEADPDGSVRARGAVGLITFADIEADIGDALGIGPDRRGHFWGMRGSNRLESCEILLVIGTPAQRPDAVVRMARALYRDDPEAIDDTSMVTNDGHVWADPRVAALDRHLIEAELTQVAHRSRALRHDGRTVITMCDATVADLPITTEILAIPSLNASAVPNATIRDDARDVTLSAAADALRAEGLAVTMQSLYDRVHISRAAIGEWLRVNPEQIVCTSDQHSIGDAYRSICTVDTTFVRPPPADDPPIAETPPAAAPPPPQRSPWVRIEALVARGYTEYEAWRLVRLEHMEAS
jgi:hypothetical protein